jgi:hypothetical protein
MADVLTGKTEIDAVSQEIVASIIQEELIQSAILLPTITDYSAFAVKGSDKVKIPKAGSFTAVLKAENVAASAEALTFSTDDIALDLHYNVQALIEDIADIQANVPLMDEYIRRMAKAIALKVDEEIYDELVLASVAAPDHKIDWANAPTDTVTKGDFVTAKKLLKQANVPMLSNELFFLINPKRESEILLLADFVDADKWIEGSANAKLNGMIGRAYGFNILVSNLVNDDEVVFYHKSAVGYATQMAPRLQSDKDLPNLAQRLALDMLFGVKVLDGGKRQVLVGTP